MEFHSVDHWDIGIVVPVTFSDRPDQNIVTRAMFAFQNSIIIVRGWETASENVIIDSSSSFWFAYQA